MLKQWLSIVILSSCCSVLLGADYYVSVSGSDANPGTLANPFASLERGRDALRGDGEEGGTVWIRGGVYHLDDSFALGELDSGRANRPVRFSAYNHEEVRLVGGRVIDKREFTKVSDAEVLARIQEDVRGKIVELDLTKLDIEHIEAYPDLFTDNGGIIELFCNDRRMPLSVYPNAYGDMTMKKVLVNGGGQEKPGSWRVYYNTGTPEERKALELGPPRPGVFEYRREHSDAHERWAKVLQRGVWLKGYWRIPWQNETVRIGQIDTAKGTVKLATPISNGIGNKYSRPEGNGQEIYWVLNLLEEVDRPGEWAIDFVDKKLYFYPPVELEDARILISDMRAPVIEMKGASYIEIVGLTIEGSLASGVTISDGRQCKLLGCTVRNVTQYGVTVKDGFAHEVRSCDLFSLGAGGVSLQGGDATVEPRVAAKHRVVNNDIHHFGQIERVYAPGVNVGFQGGGGGSAKINAVGMYIANNAIHHCPHAGVLFNSFDNMFEYNEIFQHCLVSNDMGAFYSYSKQDSIGYETFRYNFMHSSPEGEGIYYDNLADHPKIYGNIAYKLGPKHGRGRGYGFLMKNFSHQRVDIYNNMAVQCKVGFDITLGEEYRLENNISVQNIKDTAHLPSDQPGIHTMEDPGFIDMSRLNLGLQENARVFKDVKGFERIPFEKIGLYADEYRREVVDYRKIMANWEPTDTSETGYEILDRQ